MNALYYIDYCSFPRKKSLQLDLKDRTSISETVFDKVGSGQWSSYLTLR